jgi:HAD superfamily hydrolase (TIGR01484 family)
MHFLALAADYDGTIAHHGSVSRETVESLRRLKESGRRLLLVTGRELADLRHAFPELTLFERIVLENGSVIYDPATEEERALAPAPPAHFVEKLVERNVEPISVGRSIVATWEPHEATVLSVIRELGLELQIIFNKGAVMVLPAGVNKASGLRAALAEMDISPHNVVAVGDAENDHAFLQACGCAAAVANALSTIKEEADIALSGDHGAGVRELVERLIRDDLRIVPASRSGILVGADREGKDIYLAPGQHALIVGASGSGKSQFATLLTERMVERQLEFCVFDPEGDYDGLEHAVAVGDRSSAPVADEALKLLADAGVNAVINAVAANLLERQRLFARLLPRICDGTARSGRPHWLLVDEAHQVLPAADEGPARHLPDVMPGTVFITVSPESLSAAALRRVQVLLACGEEASETVKSFAAALGAAPPTDLPELEQREFLLWDRSTGRPPCAVRIADPRQVHMRHAGKYAAGDVGEWRSFYFRGPTKAVNFRARNLMQFLALAEEISDDIWEHHLRAGDYSAWFRHVIRDEGLAGEAANVEADRGLEPKESRKRIKDAVARRYVAPTAPI